MAYISLRDFGYSTADTQSRRHAALNAAVRARGRNAVLDRLRYVSELCSNNDSGVVMHEDLGWLSDAEDTVRLSTYGYSTKLPLVQRQTALEAAVNAVGKAKVVQRLQQVVGFNENSDDKRDVLQNDLDWVVASFGVDPAPVSVDQLVVDNSDLNVVRQNLRNALVAIQAAIEALA